MKPLNEPSATLYATSPVYSAPIIPLGPAVKLAPSQRIKDAPREATSARIRLVQAISRMRQRDLGQAANVSQAFISAVVAGMKGLPVNVAENIHSALPLKTDSPRFFYTPFNGNSHIPDGIIRNINELSSLDKNQLHAQVGIVNNTVELLTAQAVHPVAPRPRFVEAVEHDLASRPLPLASRCDLIADAVIGNFDELLAWIRDHLLVTEPLTRWFITDEDAATWVKRFAPHISMVTGFVSSSGHRVLVPVVNPGGIAKESWLRTVLGLLFSDDVLGRSQASRDRLVTNVAGAISDQLDGNEAVTNAQLTTVADGAPVGPVVPTWAMFETALADAIKRGLRDLAQDGFGRIHAVASMQVLTQMPANYVTATLGLEAPGASGREGAAV